MFVWGRHQSTGILIWQAEFAISEFFGMM